MGIELSILISTWNNCTELHETLGAIHRCERPSDLGWEVVVVNNNCTDQTDEVIERYRTSLPLVSVSEPRQGLSHGRNAGLKAAAGKWILFTDDDVRPSQNWILEYTQAFKRWPNGHFFGGPVESLFLGKRPSAALLAVATKAVSGFSLNLNGPAETPTGFLSANWAAPSEAIRVAGGFDPNRGLNPERREMRFGEESDLQRRLREMGFRGVYLPSATLSHIVPEEKCTPEYILGRAEASSYDIARYQSASFPAILRLALSFSVYSGLFGIERLIGRDGYHRQYQRRVRRAKLRSHFQKILTRFTSGLRDLRRLEQDLSRKAEAVAERDCFDSKSTFAGCYLRMRSSALAEAVRLRPAAFDSAWKAFLGASVRRGDVVIDLGANLGRVTTLMSCLVGTKGQVESFEPSPRIAARLRKRCKSMWLSNVNVHEYAVADKDGVGVLHEYEEVSGGASSLSPRTGLGYQIEQKTEVEIVTLDSYLSNLEQLRLIKMDIEGYEADALRGARRTLLKFRPIILTEVSHSTIAPSGRDCDATLALLREFGYETYIWASRKLRRVEYASDIPGKWRTRDVLCLDKLLHGSVSSRLGDEKKPLGEKVH